MEIDEHLKYTLYVLPSCALNIANMPQPTIRPVPARWGADGFAEDSRLFLVELNRHLVPYHKHHRRELH